MTPTRRYREVTGTLGHGAGGGVSGLDVEVWFRRGGAAVFKRFLWRGRTDASGAFTARLPLDDRAVERALGRARGIDKRLELWVYREERQMTFPNGPASVTWVTSKQPYGVSATVTEPGTGATGNWEVMGILYRSDRTPVGSTTVKVFQKKLNGDTQLGTSATTSPDGRYVVSFASPGSEADIYVRAEGTGGVRLATSTVYHGVTSYVRADLRLADATAQGPSDWEILDDEVTNLLPGGTTAQSLSDSNALYLGSKLDEDQVKVTSYLAAKRLAAAHSTSNLTAAVYYALLSEGLPGALGPLSGVPPARVTAALAAAVKAKASPASVNSAPASVVADLAAWRTTEMLSTSRPGSLGALLATTALPSGKRDDFLDRWRAHTGSPDAFWTALASDTDTDLASNAAEIRKKLFTGRLVLNHAPMVKAIQAVHGGSYTSARYLAQLSQANWETLVDTVVDGSPAGWPNGVQGANNTVKKQNYARMIRERVEAAFPTARIKADASAAGSGWADVTTFLGNNATFDFERTHVDGGWSGFTTTGLTDAAATKLQLKAAQRVYRLVPSTSRFAGVKALLDAGLDSAVKIEKMRMGPFVTAFSSTFGGAAGARTVYRRASQQAAQALAVYGVHTAKMQGVSIQAIPSLAEAIKDNAALVAGIPEYTNIFGESGSCECSSCESILSPGAYMVDLLSFVQDFGGEATLQGRRGDLYDVKLTCPNNDTTLPYIDLVNEVLEDRIAILDGKTQVDFSATTWTAEQLRATPEHRNDEVYDEVLSTAIFPFRLPFSLGLAESRVFLEHLGVPRHQLIRLVPSGGALATAAQEAAERLSLSSAQWELVTGTDTASGASEWWKHWGYASSTGITNPRPGTTGTVAWDNALRYVPELLKRSGLTIEELKDLLHVRYHDIATNLALSDTCNYDELEFEKASTSSLTPTQWETWFRDTATPMMRFIRLWRATGWSMLDLDRALVAFGASTLNGTSAMKVGQLVLLGDTTRRPLLELMSWFGMLDTRQGREIEEVVEPSWYDRLFQNATMEAKDPSWNRSVLEALALNTARTDLDQTGVYDLASVDNTTEPEQSAVTNAILSALQIDFDDLDRLKTRVTSLGTTVTLASLSGVARYVSLARAWGMSVEETLDFLDMSGLTPFSALPAADLAMREVTAHKAGAFSTRRLYWLLGQDADATEVEGPSEENLTEILSGLHTSLVAGDSVTRPEILRTKLAEALSLDVDIVQVLLESTAPNLTAGAEASAEDEFYTTTFLGTTSIEERADAPTQYDTVLRLHKVATILAALALDSDETSWLLSHYTSWQLLNVVLPVSATTPTTLYSGWQNLRILFAQRARLPADLEPTFVELLAAVDTGTESAFKDALVARTDWALADVDDLDGADGFNFSWRAGWRIAGNWWRFFDAMATTTRLGMTARQVSRWAASTAGTTESADIRLTTRSKYEESEWLSIVTPLQDKLRVQQRDALADYLAQRDPDVDERIDLYGDLLIDVEMMPIMQTSRMRQALCSVQLFVIRCLLAQESGLSLTSSQSDQWEWMKTYRVWEAAVKVFLWPENWIEPDLRTEMSPEFSSFSKSLSSPDLTTGAAESAYLTYLDTVNSFSKPEVLAFVHDQREDADGSVDVLYAFARTRTDPARYLWRRRDDGIRWTSWEEVGLSVNSDHLLPVIYHGRLYLFWPTIEEDTDDGSETLRQSWNVTLNMAEYRNGGWAGLGTSDEALAVLLEIVTTHSSSSEHAVTGTLAMTYEDDITLRAREEDDGLYIDLYVQTNRETTSAALERVGAFRLGGCDETLKVATLTETFQSDDTLPAGTLAQRQVFENDEGGSLFVPVDGEAAYADQPELLDDVQVDVWRLVPPTSDVTFYANETSLFFVDDARAYLIVPLEDCPDEPEQNENSFNPGRLVDPRNATDFIPPSTAPTIPATTVDIDYQLTDDDVALSQDARQDAAGGQKRGRKKAKSSFTSDSKGVLARTYAVGNTTAARLRDDTQFALVLGGDTSAVQSKIVRSLTVASDLNGDLMTELAASPRFLFQTFYHPFTCTFLGQVRRFGVDGLLAPDPDGEHADLIQQASVNPDVFDDTYDPTSEVRMPYPEEDIDFSYGGAYASYNWEVFFHGPMLIADRLRSAQRFAEARQWLHYVFDPTRDAGGGAPGGWWRIRPFTTSAPDTIGELEAILLGNTDDPTTDLNRLQWLLQIVAWRNDPFDPHKIAAIRTRAYQTWTLMRYLDNLIEWGDSLFSQDTIEAINEATNLYMLALELLGDRPKILESEGSISSLSVSDVLDGTSETRLDKVEGLLASPCTTGALSNAGASLGVLRLLGTFCAPPNPKLLAYWDTLDDRLFKIRNSMNIAGEVRVLATWDPPIDPALLVSASALGWSLASILSGLTVSRPNYRFSFMIQRAYAYCASVRSLGASLLAAYEKRDAEALARLRASHDGSVYNILLDIKNFQLEEASQNLAVLNRLKEAVQARAAYYSGLLASGTGYTVRRSLEDGYPIESGVSSEEAAQLSALKAARGANDDAFFSQVCAGLASLLPDESITVTPPFGFSLTYGGSHVGNWYRALALVDEKGIIEHGYLAQEYGIAGALLRRNAEWQFQADSATQQVDQVQAQIDAATARVAAAERDIAQTERERDNNEELLSLLEDKFTNEELYDWMLSEVASVYYQSYQLAVYVARQTQECWQCEIGADTTFINYLSYWDSAKKGMLAGERLQLELEQMESAYLDGDDREFELIKTLRLSELDPEALAQLRETQSCSFSIPEVVFDRDAPGHYFRRLKTVAVTVVHSAGTDMVVPMELTLTGAQVRTVERTSGYARTGSTDADFTDNRYVGDVIALSYGRSDFGLFNASMRDERYLPFERAGAISDWSLSLPSDYPAIRLRDVSDVEIHVRFTARQGTPTFESTVNTYLGELADESVESWKWVGTTLTAYDSRYVHFLRASHDFPDAWATLKSTGSGSPTMAVSLPDSLKPPSLENTDLYVARVWIYLAVRGDPTLFYVDVTLTFGSTSLPITLASSSSLGNQPAGVNSYAIGTRVEATALSAIGLDVDIGTWSGSLDDLDEMFVAIEWVRTP